MRVRFWLVPVFNATYKYLLYDTPKRRVLRVRSRTQAWGMIQTIVQKEPDLM